MSDDRVLRTLDPYDVIDRLVSLEEMRVWKNEGVEKRLDDLQTQIWELRDALRLIGVIAQRPRADDGECWTEYDPDDPNDPANCDVTEHYHPRATNER